MEKTNEVTSKEVIKENVIVEKEVKPKKAHIVWTGDFEHFNKDYGFVYTVPTSLCEIYILNDSNRYEWCEVDPSDSRVVKLLDKCSVRVKF